ncbi:vacuolar protein sorting-associated protein 33B [Zeugodacus cucurbitae]|uniref:vacuolar protein sorting-associated protein 33B n=1 Tax=Zeugodacus cucurbitae TaxID=28588 RepID=UPI000596822D|nr:vacuolar protein sorting-associated protein 33B [Zeugodacus cucurbitae]
MNTMENALEKKLQGFQLIAQEKLQAIICSIPGKKDLIIEPGLIKPLEHVCAASWLKLKGIQRIFKFDADHIISRTAEHQVHIFLIHSKFEIFQQILMHIHELERQDPTDLDAAVKSFHIICVPTCFSHFHILLEEEGLYGLVQLHRYNWDFICLDQGVLSMEIPNVFSTLFLRKDTSLLPVIAQSLRVLQIICGRPEVILTFGEHSANLVKMMQTLSKPGNENCNDSSTEFAAFIIIDRDKDYASSLLTPAIYAGLLLEVFNRRAAEIELETHSNKISKQKLQIFQLPHRADQQKQSEKPPVGKIKAKLPSIRMNAISDEIYGENRYKHFAQASSQIRAQAKTIGLEVHKLGDMKLDEMHDYVARKLPKVTELKTKVMRHLNASEQIIDMLGGNFRRVQSLEEDILNNVARKRILTEIDEFLTSDGQKFNTLRLLCLLHLCAGISSDELTQFARNYCNYFGQQHLVIFQQLAMAGLLPMMWEEDKANTSVKILSNLPLPKFQQTEFQANANRLRLMVSTTGAEPTNDKSSLGNDNNVLESVGSCPSYVFNNLYIPIAAQLCSCLLKAQSAEEFASKVGMVDKLMMHLPNAKAHNAKSFANSIKLNDSNEIFPLRKRNIFIFVLGGVTYAEVGACNLISRLTGSQIIVGSDAIISGSDLIEGAF